MRLSFTSEEIETWRDKVHRRTTRLAVRTKMGALKFIEEVGFCFAFKAENSESPCLWHAAVGERNPIMPRHTHHDPHINFVWNMKDILPSERKIYYGKLLRNRPTFVSLEYFQYFYALSQRVGSADEYLTEFAKGELSSSGKAIMDALTDSSPQITKGLRIASGLHAAAQRGEFDRAIAELQRKMFIVKVAEHYDPFSFEWETVLRRFASETRSARKISPDSARQRVLQKYFENQLVASVVSIRRLFGWKKQDVYRTLGQLKNAGLITPDVLVDGRDGKFYALLH